MKYKIFSTYFTVAIALFVIFNFLIWNLFTKEILIKNNSFVIGDLARMGYLTQYSHKRVNIDDLTKKHDYIPQENMHYDIITIGDSFSNGGGWGKNKFYQDYFATINNWHILNLPEYPYSRNYLNMIVILLKSGFFEKYKTKYILIESTQRKIIGRFSRPIDYTKVEKLVDIGNFYKKRVLPTFNLPDVSFINNGNFKYVAYNLLYPFSSRAFFSKVHKVPLKNRMFSIKDGKTLLFYHQDIRAIKNSTQENLLKVNNNLNEITALLQDHGISLIFMPAVSKYDLYSDFIDGDYIKDPFFDIYRKLDKNYIFIDTKDILTKEIEKGEKDIFYVDDTHWSYKASEAIAKHLKNHQLLDK